MEHTKSVWTFLSWLGQYIGTDEVKKSLRHFLYGVIIWGKGRIGRPFNALRTSL